MLDLLAQIHPLLATGGRCLWNNRKLPFVKPPTKLSITCLQNETPNRHHHPIVCMASGFALRLERKNVFMSLSPVRKIFNRAMFKTAVVPKPEKFAESNGFGISHGTDSFGNRVRSHLIYARMHGRAKYRFQSSQKRNQTILNYGLSLMIGTVALSYGSVPMYKMICQTAGWGGLPIKAPLESDESRLSPDRLRPASASVPRLRIDFQSSVSSVLPWSFKPQQRSLFVRPGESALAFYTATNNSDNDLIGVATYSVSPGQVAPYFAKIQCFCFDEQRLRANESVDMPVFFYVDKGILDDRNCKNVETITLSYTFFKARYDQEGHLRPY